MPWLKKKERKRKRKNPINKALWCPVSASVEVEVGSSEIPGSVDTVDWTAWMPDISGFSHVVQWCNLVILQTFLLFKIFNNHLNACVSQTGIIRSLRILFLWTLENLFFCFDLRHIASYSPQFNYSFGGLILLNCFCVPGLQIWWTDGLDDWMIIRLMDLTIDFICFPSRLVLF